VKYVVSPYESDAQIAFLLKNGYADVAVTEDDQTSWFMAVKR
jgi:hypothetical protein